MKKPIPPAFTVCVICGKPVETGQKYEFSKAKRGKTQYFHTECYEKIKKMR